MSLSDLIVAGLPWLLSAITIYMTVLAGNKHRWAWAVGLGNQALWLVWIIASASWGLLPMNLALWVVYGRNHLKWRAARAEGPEPQTIPLGAKQAAIEALEPFAIALEHFKDPRPYLLLESFHRAAEALAVLRAEGRPSPEGEEWTARLEVQRADKVWEVRLATYAAGSTVPRLGEVLAGPFDARDAATNWIEDNRAALSTPSPERAEGATAGEVKGNLPADPASVLPVLAHLVATGEATAKQRAELAAALSQPSQVGKEEANQIGAAEAEVGRYVYRRIECLMDAKSGTPESAELDYLTDIVTHVEEYGEEACADHPMGSPPAPSPEAGREEAVRRAALSDADEISERIHAGGYRANLSDVERLRNHVRKLAALSPPTPEHEVKEALNMTGLRTIAEVIDMANIGQSLMENIALLKRAKGPFKDWTPADDPAEIVFDLVNHYEDALSPPAPEPEDLEDEISEALQNSLDLDWTCRDGAKAVMRLLEARRA